ncbi:MAG TPA: PQQ-binding-like beta-propeller repeat protein, partial [Anaeromyxobacter sp.]|nr:PQQ-binding-like beta-propeller repeat protein [Anaeromyxobacter sp.]
MIRIRPGQSWRHDPRLHEALREGRGGAAARSAVDALAVEVDGFDIAGGRAEGELLPGLESLLRAVARLVSGAPVATVAFRDGGLELVLRRRGSSALLTVVEPSPPSRVLARDVEVDLDGLAAAALEASADLLRDLAALTPAGGPSPRIPEVRSLRAAARDLRRTEAAPPAPPAGEPPPSTAAVASAPPGAPACRIGLHDDEGVLLAYEGGLPDVGSLLVPGAPEILAADGTRLAAWTGMPFLALRDLGAASSHVLAALRGREATARLALPRGSGTPEILLDLAAGTARLPGALPSPCPALSLVRAIAEAATSFARLARRRNPRQGENGHLAELESSAADRLAQADELHRGDVAAEASREPASLHPPASPGTGRRLGPGRLRRLSFRRTFRAEVGPPAGAGLLPAGGLTVIAGASAIVAVERATGAVRWSAPGVEAAWLVPGGAVVARRGSLAFHELASGAVRWSVPAEQAAPASVLAPAGGLLVSVEAGTLRGLDPSSGEQRWRFAPPGASRLHAVAAGERVVAGADTGFVYGIEGSGRTAFRVLGPGPVVRPASAGRGACLLTCAVDPGAALLALDAATGRRRWEAPLDFVPTSGPVAWGRRHALAGGLAGDAMVTALSAEGAPVWLVSPPLSGAPTLAAAGALLVARGPDGALVALGRDGSVRWSRAAAPGAHPPATLAPAVVRGTVLAAGEGLVALDA